MSTQKIPSCYRNQRDPYYASFPGTIINPHWLELPMSRTNFHGPKGVRAIEVRRCIYQVDGMPKRKRRHTKHSKASGRQTFSPKRWPRSLIHIINRISV